MGSLALVMFCSQTWLPAQSVAMKRVMKEALVVAGNPWSEEEHRNFLAGLKKLGKVSLTRYPRFYHVAFARTAPYRTVLCSMCEIWALWACAEPVTPVAGRLEGHLASFRTDQDANASCQPCAEVLHTPVEPAQPQAEIIIV